jgi:FMN phosphatase YigB (HAD superfamily)
MSVSSTSSVVFDLDDTLLDTHTNFVKGIDILIAFMCAQLSISDTSEIIRFTKEFSDARLGARALHYVNPEPLWSTTLELTYAKYAGLKDHHRDLMALIWRHIYETPVALKPYALEVLSYLQSQDYRLGLVTNAELDWTLFKLENSGLDRFFQPGVNTIVVPGNERKSATHWRQGIALCDSTPQNATIVGDNARADMWEGSLRCGASGILLHEPELNWDVHSAGMDRLGYGIVVINGLGQLPEALKSIRERREQFLPALK